MQKFSKSTPELEKKALKNILYGCQRQLTYQHPGGGFGFFEHGRNSNIYAASTWLTAFVVESFVQAQKFVSIDSIVLIKSVDFLCNRLDQNNRFVENGYVFDRDMLGGLDRYNNKSSLALDAYILGNCIFFCN